MDAKKNQLEAIKFMQEYSNSTLWNSLRPEEIQKILDEELNDVKSKINNNEDNNKEKFNSLSNIYKAFYGKNY